MISFEINAELTVGRNYCFLRNINFFSHYCRMQQQELKVANPCPMLLSRMEETGANFTCKSCKKEVIDFRGKSTEEIKAVITPTTCGVFTSDQLSGQQSQSFFRKGLFYALTVFSFLGFQVSPLKAETNRVHTTNLQMDQMQVDDQQVEKPKKKKRAKKKSKEIVYRTIGTPSF